MTNLTEAAEAPQELREFPVAPAHAKTANTAAIALSITLVGVFVAAGIVGSIQNSTIADLRTTITAQEEQIDGLQDDLLVSAAETVTCRAEALAWKDATVVLATDVSDWLGTFPFGGELDLTASEAASESAKATGCTE